MEMNVDVLKKIWCRETAHPSYQKDWTEDNPSYGQCAVTALLINDLCCVPIYKCRVGRKTHYFNMWAGRCEVIDLTSEQFGSQKIDYLDCESVLREQLLKCEHVKERYEMLKTRLENYYEQ